MSEETKDQNTAGAAGESGGGSAPAPAKALPVTGVGPGGPENFGPESQRDRWIKYGSNVALSVVVVVVLAGLVIWLTQTSNLHLGKTRFSFRKSIDVTSDASLSLKPQTVSVIRDLKEPVKLVSLYPKLKREEAGTKQDFYTPVQDLLEEYRQKGHNIDVESIDPVNEPAKLDHWIGELKDKYGSNTKAYHDLLAQDLPKSLEQLNKLATAESDAMDKELQSVEFKNREQVAPFRAAYNTVAGFPQILDQVSKGAQEELQKQFPNYKAYTSTLKQLLGTLSSQSAKVRTSFDKLKDDKDLPEPARKYAGASAPKFDEMKKLADDLVEKINKLGELKLDEVRRKLFGGEEGEAPPPAIAVMGPTDIKLISFNDVWNSGQTTRLAAGPVAGPPKLSFNGERQVTGAIVALEESKRQKVCFVRAGGESRLAGGFMRGGGDLSDIADRLKSYNFDVSEKDVTKDPSQPPMSQMPTPPEPSVEEIKDAIWVVLDEPSASQFGPMPASPELGNKLKQHLDEGGSAVCLVSWRGDALAAALKDWGIEAKPEVVAVHEPIEATGAEPEDFIEDARRRPPIFVLSEYGDSPVTSPLRALDSVLVPLCVIQQSPGSKTADVTTTPIIPVPADPKSWGESDTSRLGDPDAPAPTFDSKSGDIAQPIYGGAVAEKKGKGRLVVLGCSQFISNNFLRMPDPKILKQQKVDVARFPGNGELFTNSVFWCSHQEQMIALSPSALDTARIEPIKPGLLNFWRVGVVLIGLPLLAVASGFVVYQTRRA